MEADFQRLMKHCNQNACEPEHVVSVYNKIKLSKLEFTFTSAVGGSALQSLDSADYVSGAINTQRMLEIQHRGPYRFIGNAWSLGHLLLRHKKLKLNGPAFEYYHNDPEDTPETDLLTSIYFPIK